MPRTTQARQIEAGRTDPIRIVPLHHPQALQAASPLLTYRNGPLMTAVEVFTVFWGAEWDSAPLKTMMDNLNGFFDYILASALMDQLGEYSTPKYKISHGKRTGTTVITPTAHSSVTDTCDSETIGKRNCFQQKLSATWEQHAVLSLYAGRNQGGAGRSEFLPGILRLSQRHQWADFLCGDAVSGMRGLYGRTATV